MEMPRGFQKPFDYSVDLMVRSHPTLREYVAQRKMAESDPDYALHNYPRVRQDPRDEVQLRNNIGVSQVNIVSLNRS